VTPTGSYRINVDAGSLLQRVWPLRSGRPDPLRKRAHVPIVEELDDLVTGDPRPTDTAPKVNVQRTELAEPAVLPDDATSICPFCAEEVKAVAIRCKHCHADLTSSASLSHDVRHRCPNCKGANTASVRSLWEQGTSAVTSVSRLAQSGVISSTQSWNYAPTYSEGVAETIGLSQSALATRLAPPDEPPKPSDYSGCLHGVWLSTGVALIAIAVLNLSAGPVIVTAGFIVVVCLFAATNSNTDQQKQAVREHEERLLLWSKQWHCLRCGHTFIPT
jgi:phage FluMu protein Com